MAKGAQLCPTCDEPVSRDGKSAPFCSERCKLVDLGHWLRGDYVVPGEDAISLDEVSALEARRAARIDQEAEAGGDTDADG